MATHGIKPLVGMKCLILFSSSNYSGAITYMGDGVGCFKELNGKEYTFALNGVTFKPLTLPVELIDGECYQGTHKGNGKLYKGVYVKSLDEIFHGKGSNPSRFYVNIQPLTVKAKS